MWAPRAPVARLIKGKGEAECEFPGTRSSASQERGETKCGLPGTRSSRSQEHAPEVGVLRPPSPGRQTFPVSHCSPQTAKSMEAPRSPPTAGQFVVVGGGIAGVTCAEQVRRARKRFRLSETLEALALEAPSRLLSLVFLPGCFHCFLFPYAPLPSPRYYRLCLGSQRMSWVYLAGFASGAGTRNGEQVVRGNP